MDVVYAWICSEIEQFVHGVPCSHSSHSLIYVRAHCISILRSLLAHFGYRWQDSCRLGRHAGVPSLLFDSVEYDSDGGGNNDKELFSNAARVLMERRNATVGHISDPSSVEQVGGTPVRIVCSLPTWAAEEGACRMIISTITLPSSSMTRALALPQDKGMVIKRTLPLPQNLHLQLPLPITVD